MTYDVVFDIDKVLALSNVESFDQARFFAKKGAVLTAIKTHYIFPGAIELIRVVALDPKLRLTFFSAGYKDRNVELVAQLLNLALPEPEYAELKSKVRVLSYEDWVNSREVDENGNGIVSGQKDLRKVVSKEEDLANAVLIDDQMSNIAPGQGCNFLQVPVSEAKDYSSLIEKMEFYDPESGAQFMNCVMSLSGSKDELVKTGNHLFIQKNGESFQIECVNQNFEIQVASVFKDCHETLYKQLDYFYHKIAKSGVDVGTIGDPVVVRNICNYVGECEGKSRQFYREVNRICYVGGLLFLALNHAETEKISLSKALSAYLFTANRAEKKCVYNFDKLKENDRIYAAGLDKLRTVNPNYEFITPHNYRAYSQWKITKKDHIFLKTAIENEFVHVL